MPSDEVLEGSDFLPLDTSTHLYIHDFVFIWVQSGQLPEHYPHGERVLQWINYSTDKLWWDRGDACPERVMFTEREAEEEAAPQLGVSVSHLLITHTDLGSVWKHPYYKKTLFLPSSKWDAWISSTPRRGSLLCVSLLTRDCRVKLFPSRKETVGPVLSLYMDAALEHPLSYQQETHPSFPPFTLVNNFQH